MPVDTVLVSALGPDRRAACLAEGRLVRFVLTPPDGAAGGGPRAGDVYLGRITAVDRRLAAAFVDIGAARPGFLSFADALDPRRLPGEGDAVVVRVMRAADDGKGARLAARPPPAPELLVRTKTERAPARLQTAPDPITAAIAAAADTFAGSTLARVVVDDAEALVTLRRTLPAIAPLFQHHAGAVSVFAAAAVDDQLAAALAPRQALPSGGALAIRETPAAVTIDVDLGAATGASAAFATNLEAMTAIADAIVLGELAGHIVIDPIAVRDRQQRGAVLTRLREALTEADALLGDDHRIVRLGGFTSLGLIELVRERRAPSLRRQLGITAAEGGEPASAAAWVAAGDALRAVVARAATHPGRVPALIASGAVGEALAGMMAAARVAAETRAGGRIDVRIVAPPPAFTWRLEDAVSR